MPTYFCLNTGLVAIAIGVTTDRPAWRVWREDFLWSAASFMVAGSAGAIAAVVIERGEQWKAVLMLAPVYLTYRTYYLFVGRLADEQRHQARLAAALQETQAARAAAEEANGLKDQFLATVSHELRTPLNAILGWADMLRAASCRNPGATAACDAIFNNAQRQARLIDELLDMARIMSGKLRLEHARVEPREIVSGALETVQPSADAKNITIHTEIDPDAAPFYGDMPRLQQVLWNLLSNAVKFTPNGGEVHVRVARRGNTGELTVADSGSGIPATSCRRSSSRSGRPTDRRRGCTTGSASACRSSSISSRRTADRWRSKARARGAARPSRSACRLRRADRRSGRYRDMRARAQRP